MAFSAQFLDELRARVGLADVVGRRVRLIRKGREHSGLCPFHKEKTPSFTVSEEKGFYHCFGCGAHGSVFDFVMQSEGLSFPEAVERLAAQAGMPVPRDTPEEREKAKRRQSILDVLEAAAAYYERALRLPEGRGALGYLGDRGLDDATIQRFRLGFAPATRGAIRGALTREGFTDELIAAAGLVKDPDDGRPAYDYFRNRIIFPITDRRGRVIAFGGRLLGDGEPKYLNSPETGVFHKGRTLYGLAQAHQAARKSGRLVVTEGYMDVIALHGAGFEGAVAPLGTALTEDQLTEAWRLVAEPVLAFDGDAAGAGAAARAAERALPLLRPGYGLRIAFLPAGEDPDSLIRKRGRDALERVLAGAQPLSEALWHRESRGRMPATSEDRAALQKRLEEHAGRIRDATVRAHFLKGFRDRLWAPKPGVAAFSGTSSLAAAGAGPATAVDPAATAERVLLAAVLNHPDLFHQVEEALGSAVFADGPLDALRRALISILSGADAQDPPALRAALEERGLKPAVDEVFRDPLVRAHRLIAPGAALADALATWDEALGVLSQKDRTAERARVRDELARDLTPEGWERRRALIRAGHDD
jgi:DNA primase